MYDRLCLLAALSVQKMLSIGAVYVFMGPQLVTCSS